MATSSEKPKKEPMTLYQKWNLIGQYLTIFVIVITGYYNISGKLPFQLLIEYKILTIRDGLFTIPLIADNFKILSILSSIFVLICGFVLYLYFKFVKNRYRDHPYELSISLLFLATLLVPMYLMSILSTALSLPLFIVAIIFILVVLYYNLRVFKFVFMLLKDA